MARYRNEMDDDRDYYRREDRLRRESLGAYDEPYSSRSRLEQDWRPDYNRGGRFGEAVRTGDVIMELRAPNGRAVQMTTDLRSFWERTYPEVRRELRGRYPRHPWPEDPWSAPPTARTTRRTG